MKKSYFKILFYITALTVLYLAIIPHDYIDIDLNHSDKIKHIIAFFTLSLLLNRASSSIQKRLRNMASLLLFGAFIEIVQLYFPQRDSSVEDLIADFIGILLFQVLYSILKFLQGLIKKSL